MPSGQKIFAKLQGTVGAARGGTDPDFNPVFRFRDCRCESTEYAERRIPRQQTSWVVITSSRRSSLRGLWSWWGCSDCRTSRKIVTGQRQKYVPPSEARRIAETGAVAFMFERVGLIVHSADKRA